MVAKISKVENVIESLPAGTNVGDKPQNLEFLGRRSGKYDTIIKALEVIASTKCVKITVENPDKKVIQSIKWGINSCAKRLNFKRHIKFCFDENLHMLYIWAN